MAPTFPTPTHNNCIGTLSATYYLLASLNLRVFQLISELVGHFDLHKSTKHKLIAKATLNEVVGPVCEAINLLILTLFCALVASANAGVNFSK